MDNQAIENYSCKSCGQGFEGSYCPSCGQKKIVNRLVLKDSIRHLLGVMVNFEKGLWHTTIWMFKRPGKVINDYLNGVTKPYIHPFRYLFLWLTINLFLMFSTGLFDQVQAEMAVEMNQESNPISDLLLNWMKNYMQLFFLVSIPFLALGTKVLFRKMKLNFAEHLVINSFGYGTAMVVSTLIIPFYFLFPDYHWTVQMISLILGVSIHGYLYSGIFKQNIFLAIFKAIFAYIFWIIGFFLTILLFLIIYITYLGFTDPELLKATFKKAEILINPETIVVLSQLV